MMATNASKPTGERPIFVWISRGSWAVIFLCWLGSVLRNGLGIGGSARHAAFSQRASAASIKIRASGWRLRCAALRHVGNRLTFAET
jgi:hypothetical protein